MSNKHPLRRLLALTALSIGLLAGTLSVPAGAATNNEGSSNDNACTAQQLEGGYVDIDGRCQLTGWNWDFGGQCPGQRDASVGRYGGGSCAPEGCITPTCGGGGGPGGGGGGGGTDPNDLDGDGQPDWSDLEDGRFDVSNLQDFVNWCLSEGTNFQQYVVDDWTIVFCDSDGIRYNCTDYGDSVGCEAFPIPEIFPAPDPATTVEHNPVDEVSEPVGEPVPTAPGPTSSRELSAEVSETVSNVVDLVRQAVTLALGLV